MTILIVNSRVTEVALPLEQLKYRTSVDGYLNRNPFARFKIFISAGALEKHVAQEYPQVAKVESHFSFFGNTMDVRVTERQAQLLLKTDNNMYFIVDTNGYAYDTVDIAAKTSKMVVLTDDTQVKHNLDETVVSASLISFIEQVDPLLRQINSYKSQEFSYRITDEARVLYIKPNKEKYEIKMQLDRPASSQVRSLDNALRFFAKRSIYPLNYIDVRVNGTVYYK